MKTSQLRTDYENIQQKKPAVLNGHPFEVPVFVGTNQAKTPLKLASCLQAPGGNAKFVKIGGDGANALDFHNASYIGQLAEREPCANAQTQDPG